MRVNLFFVSFILLASASFAQGRLPHSLKDSATQEQQNQEPVVYREGLTGLHKMALSVIQPPSPLKSCITQQKITKMIQSRMKTIIKEIGKINIFAKQH